MMGRDEQAQLIGDGWSPVDFDEAGPFRWMTSTEARLVLPVTRDGSRRIRVQVFRNSRSPACTLRLRLNTTDLAWQPLHTGLECLRMERATRSARSGPNEAAIIVDRLSPARNGTGPRDVAVTDLRLIGWRNPAAAEPPVTTRTDQFSFLFKGCPAGADFKTAGGCRQVQRCSYRRGDRAAGP